MENSNPNLKKTDWRILLGLIGLTAAFFIPLLFGWEKFFYDDIAFIFYPQQVFISRCFARGIVPWWDPNICAGAVPFYCHIFQSSLYPINWIFLSAGSIFAACDYDWLVKVPLALHFVLAAFFSFLFARLGLRLNRAGSLVLAVAYTFSPTMTYMSTYPPEVYIQAWLPFYCLCLLSFSRDGRYRWLIAGAITFAVGSTAGDVPFVLHVVMICSLFGIGLVVVALLRQSWKTVIRLIVGGVIIFGIGFLLAGVYWSNMLEGLMMLRNDAVREIENLSGIRQSLHPLYLTTLFVPDLFGGITSYHTWGAAFEIHCCLNDANLLGGLAAIFIVLLAIRPALKPKNAITGERDPRRGYWWIFFSLFIVGLFTVLGPYTPVYRILRVIIPVLKMPYPIRFRSMECFAFAGLLGTSVSFLREDDLKKRHKLLFFYLGFVFLCIGQVLISPYRDGKMIFSPGGKHLTFLNDWIWFLTGPLMYLIVVGALIFVGTRYIKKCRVIFFVLLVLAELTFFGYQAFYLNRVLNRRYRDFSADRYYGPADHPIYKDILSWAPEKEPSDGLYRRLYYRSYFDNLASINNKLTILGFDIKPLEERFQEVLKELTKGFPYEILVKRWGSAFWPNMSVRYILARNRISLPHFKFQRKIGVYYTYELENSLPRFYFQDKWIRGGEAEQKEALLGYDLRDNGYCDDGIWRDCTGIEEGNAEEGPEHFNELQIRNRVSRSDLTNPNRMILEVEISKPSMLVVTDVWYQGWRVIVDGEAADLHRVNYLQRGVWCHPGRHRIIMEFIPPTLHRGILLTGIGIVGLIVLIVVARIKKSRQK